VIHVKPECPRMAPVAWRFDPAPLVAELDAHPELWNQYRFRTEHPRSPHREADDVWLRYNDVKNLDPANPTAFNDEHVAVWYPAAEKTPLIRMAAESLAFRLGARTMGAVLITRVPAGKQIYPHVDGGWHAKAHRKFLVLLRGNMQQSFLFENEGMYAEAGEIFEFQNEYAHSVRNQTDFERISMIVCLRDFAHSGD
jgi:hypothetical protein